MAELENDCFWFPNLEKCQQVPDPGPEPVGPAPVGPVERTVVAEEEYINPWFGQVSFYVVAVCNLFVPAMI